SGVSNPIKCVAYFSGTGLASENEASINGNNFNCYSFDLSDSPFKKLWTISLVSFGKTFATTDITPSAPTDSIGTVKSSFPEIIWNSSGVLFLIFIVYDKSPDASLIPQIFLCLDSSTTTFSVIL